MKNLDEVFDIYQSFLDFVSRDYKYNVDFYETAKADDNGKERALLRFNNGFNVELTNQRNVENSATMHCWWHEKEKAVEVSTLDQLKKEFYSI